MRSNSVLAKGYTDNMQQRQHVAMFAVERGTPNSGTCCMYLCVCTLPSSRGVGKVRAGGFVVRETRARDQSYGFGVF